jgi:hypothetical protein
LGKPLVELLGVLLIDLVHVFAFRETL